MVGIMGSKAYGQNVGEVLIPIYNRALKNAEHNMASGTPTSQMTEAETEFLMHEYDPIHEMVLDYQEIASIFGKLPFAL